MPPRKLRINVPGGFYHAILRGNRRQDIFDNTRDRQIWESLVSEIGRYGHRLHAYCWMSNHVHMAIQAGPEPLARFMSFLASNYSRKTNLIKHRSGHLFERRYRAILVQEDSYLLELVRYIHLNPVRARIAQSIINYKWSSHHSYMGTAVTEWLTTTRVLSLFSTNQHEARIRYAEFMGEQPNVDIGDRLRTGSKLDSRTLGADSWLEDLVITKPAPGPLKNLEFVIDDFCRRYGVTAEQLASPSREHFLSQVRAEIALTASSTGSASISEVARRFGRSQPTLSRAVSRLRKATRT